jgi:hypothetical protein
MIGLIRAGLVDVRQFHVDEFPLEKANDAVAHASRTAGALRMTVVRPWGAWCEKYARSLAPGERLLDDPCEALLAPDIPYRRLAPAKDVVFLASLAPSLGFGDPCLMSKCRSQFRSRCNDGQIG